MLQVNEQLLQEITAPIVRELIDKQWNSLVFRMRSDLVKKNGKWSK